MQLDYEAIFKESSDIGYTISDKAVLQGELRAKASTSVISNVLISYREYSRTNDI